MELATHVFVYGTLRPGNPNHRLIAGSVTDAVDLTVEGLQLLVPGHGCFPYARLHPGSRTHGTLLRIDPAQWPTAKERLDRLEGYRESSDTGHYLRRQITLPTPDGVLDAWVYLAGRIDLTTLSPAPGDEWSTPAPARR